MSVPPLGQPAPTKPQASRQQERVLLTLKGSQQPRLYGSGKDCGARRAPRRQPAGSSETDLTASSGAVQTPRQGAEVQSPSNGGGPQHEQPLLSGLIPCTASTQLEGSWGWEQDLETKDMLQ